MLEKPQARYFAYGSGNEARTALAEGGAGVAALLASSNEIMICAQHD